VVACVNVPPTVYKNKKQKTKKTKQKKRERRGKEGLQENLLGYLFVLGFFAIMNTFTQFLQ